MKKCKCGAIVCRCCGQKLTFLEKTILDLGLCFGCEGLYDEYLEEEDEQLKKEQEASKEKEMVRFRKWIRERNKK